MPFASTKQSAAPDPNSSADIVENSVTWEEDVNVDPDEVILAAIMENLESDICARLQEDFGDELAATFEQALAGNGQFVRMLLQSGVPVVTMFECLRGRQTAIKDQATLDALLDHGLSLELLLGEAVPFYLLVSSAYRDERLFDVLLAHKNINLDDLLLAKADPTKLARHLDRFSPVNVRLLLQYGIPLPTLEAYIDQCDAVNEQRGYAPHYFRRRVQDILDSAHTGV